jgi:hypothetical protein
MAACLQACLQYVCNGFLLQACLQYVCNGYDYDEACEELGEGLELCRKIGANVTAAMKNPKPNGNPGCYRDLFSSEDNRYHPNYVPFTA